MNRLARIVIEERAVAASGKEQDRGGGIEHFAGNPLRLEVLFTRLDRIVNDAAVTAVAAAVLADDFSGASFADASTAEIDNTVTADDWNSRAKATAALEFTGEQMELPIAAGKATQRYVIVFYFSDYTFGWCYLTLRRDGIPATPAALPNQAGNIIPEGAHYDGAGLYERAVTAGQFYLVGFAANDDSLTNGPQEITDTLTAFQAQGATIVLHGTASAAVTAAVRANPTLSSAEIIALISSLSGSHQGNGSPEGVQVGVPGQSYLDLTADAVWFKKTGIGNTGWKLYLQL